jgi:hypothetical protein
MIFLHAIERIFGKHHGTAPPAVPAKATDVPAAAKAPSTAPAAVGTFTGTNPQHATA